MSTLGVFPQTLPPPLILKSRLSRFWSSLVQLDWPASKPSICLSSLPYHRGYKHRLSFLAFPHGLWAWDSGPQDKSFTDWAIFSAQVHSYFNSESFLIKRDVTSPSGLCVGGISCLDCLATLSRPPFPQITTQRFVINYKCSANSTDLFVVVSSNLNWPISI